MEQEINVKARGFQWIDIIAVILAFFAALICISGSIGVYESQVKTFNSPMWPLPGLVLLYWLILGVANLVLALIITRGVPNKYLYASWFVNGAFIPLIILGALSIGSMVFFGWVFFALSSILLSIHKKGKLITSLGLFVLGVLISAVISMIMIAFANPPFVQQFFSHLLR